MSKTKSQHEDECLPAATKTSSLSLLDTSHLQYPWDKAPHETPEEFALFRIYLGYGPAREGSYERMSRRTGEPEHTLRKLAEDQQWYTRGESYQEYIKTIIEAHNDDRRQAREVAVRDDLDDLIEWSTSRLKSQIMDEAAANSDAAGIEEWLLRIQKMIKSRKDLGSDRKDKQVGNAGSHNIIMSGTFNMTPPVKGPEMVDVEVVDTEEEDL